jgi:hypothetical protein
MTPSTKKRRPQGRRSAVRATRARRRERLIEQIVEKVGKIARRVSAAPALYDGDMDAWMYDEHGLPH